MIKRKRRKEKGTLALSKYFQEIKPGDKVALIRNLSYKASFPRRLQGITGTIITTRGKAFVVNLCEGKKDKTFIIRRVHLKKVKSGENKK